MYEIVTIETSSLGDRSYLVHDGQVAAVVDPQRDIDRVQELVASLGVQVRHVLETHIHNDYVTGGHALAQVTGADYHVNAEDPVGFERHEVRDGAVVELGDGLALRAMATPGHTYTHLSYVLLDRTDGDRPVAVFTGGSMLYGSSGRPDLLGPDHTEPLARHQHASLNRLASELPDDVAVYPTHGFGSFCSATQTSGDSSTIGREKDINPALTQDEEAFLAELLAGLDAFPAYYAHMGPANLQAPTGAPDLAAPATADPAELRRRVEAGEWVVDLRSRTAFAAGHLGGTYNLGLDGQFSTYLGWLIPWGTPLTLLGESAEQVAAAQRELVRIGIDRPAAAATGAPGDWTGGGAPETLRRSTFEELAGAYQGAGADGRPTVLDVRRDSEWAGGHLDGATHIPLHQLLRRMDEVPVPAAERPLWLHCQSGYRASIAASILAAAGHPVVLVDDSFDRTRELGLPVVSG